LGEKVVVLDTFISESLGKYHPRDSFQALEHWTEKHDIFWHKFVMLPVCLRNKGHWYMITFQNPFLTQEALDIGGQSKESALAISIDSLIDNRSHMAKCIS